MNHIPVTGDKRRAQLLDELRRKIAKEFGVTLIDPHMTLRFTAEDGEHVEVSFLATEITEYVRSCDSCSTRTDKLFTAVMRVKTHHGAEHMTTQQLCFDCSCPK